METVLTIGLTGLKLIAGGACLGVGFWASKKITNKVDEYLLLYDTTTQRRLAEGMNLG